MRVRGGISSLKDHLGLLIVLGIFALLWQTLQAAAAFELDPNSAAARALDGIHQAAPGIIKRGDVVFVSSQDAELPQRLAQLGASVYELDASDAGGAGSPLLRVLDDRCKLDSARGQPAAYWVWTTEHAQTPVTLGAVRARSEFLFYVPGSAALSWRSRICDRQVLASSAEGCHH